ncbi:MAG: hypothetical protein Ct9H300mP8_07400 [Gammaproteobacteria bacterium]|nr:MAG: hypothetical protein Ct9H300mP8_07400 [Gammaproteobacteria bacterium]
MAHFHAQLLKPEADWNPGVREPVIGVTLHVYLASSKKAAIARVHQAYPAYHRNLVTLFKRYDIPFTDPSLGGNTELALTLGVLVAAAPEDAIAQIEHLIDETGIEYLTLSFAWGISPIKGNNGFDPTICRRSHAAFQSVRAAVGKPLV